MFNTQPTLLRVALITGVLTVILGGCRRSGPERIAVSGTVAYQGQPIPNGTIYFIPGEGTPDSSMVGAIVAGRYKMATWGGLPVGEYRVQIEAVRDRSGNSEGPRDIAGPAGVVLHRSGEQYIPAKYNTKTELKLTVKSGSGSIRQDFDLRN